MADPSRVISGDRVEGDTKPTVPTLVSGRRLKAAAPATLTPTSFTPPSAGKLRAVHARRSAGDYRIAFELGTGGMATVFLARRRGAHGFEKFFALKHLHRELEQTPEFFDMFVDEALIASRIEHPSVCTAVDFVKGDDGHYLVMEYLRGMPLSRVLFALHQDQSAGFAADRRLPRLIARVVAELAEGLHAAHSARDEHGRALEVVHRDVSPQNLYVLFDGSVRVSDFGVARARGRRHRTGDDKLKGKIAYMAPEQLEYQRVDRRADVWSLGVVAWELLVGRRLFRCPSEAQTIEAVLAGEIEPPSRYRPSVPEALDHIVMRALQRDPSDRYQSAADLARDLERYLASAADTVPAADVAHWMRQLFPDGPAQIDGLLELARNLTADDSERPGAPALDGGGDDQTETLPPSSRRARLGKVFAGALFAVSVTALGAAFVQYFSGGPLYGGRAAAATGLLSVATPGTRVEVLYQGRVLGETPLNLTLSEGKHELLLRRDATEVRVTVPVRADKPSTVSVPFPTTVSRSP